MEAEKILKKLRMSKGQNCLIVNAPKEYKTILKGLSYSTEGSTKKKGYYDVVQVFATRQAELEKRLKQAHPLGKYDCLFWACYPKGTGMIKSDIKRETVWTAFESVGLQAVSAVAIDDTWSALRGRPTEAVGK